MLEIWGKKNCVLFSLPLSLSRSDRRHFLFSMDRIMQVSLGLPMRAPSAQPGCQQSFQSIEDGRTPGDFTARLLSNLHKQVPRTLVYKHWLSSARILEPCLCLLLTLSLVASLPRGAQRGQTGARVRGGDRPATAHSTRLCEHLQVLGRILPCYTSFLRGLPTFYTAHTHVQRVSLWQFADAITLLQTTCFQVNVSSL